MMAPPSKNTGSLRALRSAMTRARRRSREGPSAAPEFLLPASGLHDALGMVGATIFVLAAALVAWVALPEYGFPNWALLLVSIVVLGFGGGRLLFNSYPHSVVVGADGALVRGEFISYSEINYVLHEWRHEGPQNGDPGLSEGPQDVWNVSLGLIGGEVIDLMTTKYPRKTNAGDRAEREDDSGAPLARALEEARAAWVARQRAPDLEGAVSRGDRTAVQWLDALRRLGSADDSAYRAVVVDVDLLLRRLDDARERPSARAAAAVVLAASGDATTATRLRIAAESMADPRARVALENVAEASNDAAIAEALETLDQLDREERV